MKLTFNLCTVITIPVVHAHTGLIQNVLGNHLHHNANSSPEFKSVSTSFFGREFRRELQLASFGECEEKTEAQVLQDAVYNETRDANRAACPTSRDGWLTEDGNLVKQYGDYRNCNQSEIIAYCQANYRLINLPDYNVYCPKLGDSPLQYDIYYYDTYRCLARDPSCPSDSVALTEQDIASMWNSDINEGVNCTVKFLEEGHQPPQNTIESKEPDNLSEECVNEIAMMFDDAEFSTAMVEADVFMEPCKSGLNAEYSVGDDTFVVYNFSACGEQSDYNSYFDDVSYIQPLYFTNRKISCVNGNFYIYFYSLWEWAGKSCPSDQGDWTNNDMMSIFPGLEACEFEILEEGDVPPPPPTEAATVPPKTEDSPTEAATVPPKTEDSPTVLEEGDVPPPPPTEAAPVPPKTEEAQSAAASEPLLTKTIALLPAVAAMTLAALY